MIVETTDREPRSLHDVHHRTSLNAPLTKEGGGRSGNRFTRLLFLLDFLIHVKNSRRPHRPPPAGSADSRVFITHRRPLIYGQVPVEQLRDVVSGVRRGADDALGLLAVAEEDQGRNPLNVIAG